MKSLLQSLPVAAVTAAVLCISTHPADAQTVKPLPAPDTTSWTPAGCRTVPVDDPVLPSRETWTNLHGDSTSTDEISRAIGPVVVADWTAEGATYNPTGPVFDRDRNLYFAPLFPYENVALVSLDPADGSRRWSIPSTGAPNGTSTPLVLDDPDNPGEQIIYLVLYDRALAVQPDGTIVWDVSTGLTLGPDPLLNGVIGVNYLPALDAVIAIAIDGNFLALDRSTGASILNSAFEMPGERSPDIPSALPPQTLADAEDEWQLLVNLPDGSFDKFVNVVLGQDVEVANTFSIDPATGRIWIAATAPDGEDGTVDGLSEFGALYGLDLVLNGAGYDVVEACHASFAGGSASTPSMPTNGGRIYVGDNFGKLLTISATDCSQLWEVDLGQQIVGSVAVSSDNNVVYASSRDFVSEVFDNGNSGTIGWQTFMTGLFDGLSGGQTEFNLNLTSIGANGLGFQAGAGLILSDVPFAVSVGVGVLDRLTGEVRSFTAAPEETVAVMTTADDGAFYIGNSPIRRAFAIALGLSNGPLIGGITKFAVDRHDLLMRDAACAAGARADNAVANAGTCSASAEADGRQTAQLIAQIRNDAQPQALAKGEITLALSDRVDAHLTAAEAALAAYDSSSDPADFAAAAAQLNGSCSVLAACPDVPRTGCRTAGSSAFQLKRKSGDVAGDKDKLGWKWKKGEATTLADVSDPLAGAAYSLCVYTGASPALTASMTVLPGADRWKAAGSKGFKFKDKTGSGDGIVGVLAKSGIAGKAISQVKGKGASLPDPVLPMELPIVAQLVNDETGVCFTSEFDTADVSKNTADQIKAKK